MLKRGGGEVSPIRKADPPCWCSRAPLPTAVLPGAAFLPGSKGLCLPVSGRRTFMGSSFHRATLEAKGPDSLPALFLWEPFGRPSSLPASATELKSRFLFIQPEESGPGASAALLSPQEMLQDENRQRKSCGRQEVTHCLGGASTCLSHAAFWLRCFQALRKPSAAQGPVVNPSYKLQ